MKYKELREYQTLKSDELYYSIEIERLKQLKKEKVEAYSSSSISGMPSGGISSPTEQIAIANLEYAEKIDERIRECKAKLKEVQQKLAEIESFIDGITDNETKAMMRRHIKQNASFSMLARERFVSRNYVAKRIKGVCR